jgi:FkbM family methyltransferase
MKRMCNAGSVLLFEPNPVNFELLDSRRRLNPIECMNVVMSNCAVSDKDLSLEDGVKFNNSSKVAFNQIGNTHAGINADGMFICNVHTVRLDTVLDDMFVEKEAVVLRLVTIEASGHEYNVLLGMGRYLKNTQYIVFEASTSLDSPGGPRINSPLLAIVKLLELYDFDVYRVGNRKMLKISGDMWHDRYEIKLSHHSYCFAIKKDDTAIDSIIDDTYSYVIN